MPDTAQSAGPRLRQADTEPAWVAIWVPADRLTTLVAMTPVVAVAVLWRVWRLNTFGFNSDEAVYAGQAASIAGDPTLDRTFPIFRAHPLVFQTILSLVYRVHTGDLTGRLVAAAFGVATVLAVYLLGKELFHRSVGVAAALFVAVMPYDVVVTRQVLLDGPLALMATLTLWLLARYCRTREPRWLYATSAMLGLTILTKEIAVLLLGSLFAFFALHHRQRMRWRQGLVATAILFGVVWAMPVSLHFSGRTSSGQSYFVYQIFRRSNHGFDFYPTAVPPALGWAVLGLAVAGWLWLRLADPADWRPRLLFWWLAIPTIMLELWPVKGFQYLLFLAPAVAVLAAHGLLTAVTRLPAVPHLSAVAHLPVVKLAAVVVVALTLAVPAWQQINPSGRTTFLAGSGGLPGGREAGQWIDANLPLGAKLMTIGPSMANIVAFYGHRQALGLSVSPNPLNRNPSYQPMPNPDAQIRQGEVQYLVWDSFSAARAPSFAGKLLTYARKYNGVVTHSQTIMTTGSGGQPVPRTVITIYEVRP